MKVLRDQKGFTLIELVLIIVILGVLAIIAIPKFVDISAEANAASLKGVAGGMSSGMATNYAVRKANAAKGSAVVNCTDVGSTMAGGVPTGYTVTSLAIATDVTASCTVTQTATSNTATFVGIGIP
jgi:prepilin-type N-terminal cleavage/methylation domain-containing protein